MQKIYKYLRKQVSDPDRQILDTDPDPAKWYQSDLDLDPYGTHYTGSVP